MLNIRARYQTLKAGFGPSDISPTLKNRPVEVGEGYRYWKSSVPKVNTVGITGTAVLRLSEVGMTEGSGATEEGIGSIRAVVRDRL